MLGHILMIASSIAAAVNSNFTTALSICTIVNVGSYGIVTNSLELYIFLAIIIIFFTISIVSAANVIV